MLRSLLVPLDGTRFSEGALPLAEGIAQATGADLHLAHVHVPHPPDALLSNTQFHFEGVDLNEYDEHDRSWERIYLDGLTQKMSQTAAAEVDAVLLDGDVEETLRDYAHQVKADVVVISTHARTGMRRAWMGSVAEALIRAGDLPVLAVHAEEDGSLAAPSRLDNVLVPLDGSDLSESILPHAVELAQAFDAKITLLHVISSRFSTDTGLVPALPQHWTEALQEGEDYLDRIAHRVRARGLRADPMVIANPHTAKAICEVADEINADVVALATHGYTGLKRALFGSVAESVLRLTESPVLVRRPL